MTYDLLTYDLQLIFTSGEQNRANSFMDYQHV